MNTENTNNVASPATFDEIRAILRDVAVSQAASSAKFDKRISKLEDMITCSDAQLTEKQRSSRDYLPYSFSNSRRLSESIKELDERIMWEHKDGIFENYFYNTFEQGKRNFFGEEFYELRKNVGGLKIAAEYDFILINGQSVAIIEVKYKAHENDISKVLKKAITFRANFPEYQNHKIYLGLASMAFYPELEHACIDNGIAIVKQLGDTIVLNYDNLRTY